MVGLNSMQICMDTNDWLKGLVADHSNSSNPSPPSLQGDLIVYPREGPPHPAPVSSADRRLRPPSQNINQSLKCPRCDSTHTKFCYYNNYSLSQPRYFCKTCRRYWTHGGSLRNVPVGGGCRKNKRPSTSGAAASRRIPTELSLTFNPPNWNSIWGSLGFEEAKSDDGFEGFGVFGEREFEAKTDQGMPSLMWEGQSGCSGYTNGVGSLMGVMNGYGSSNPLM